MVNWLVTRHITAVRYLKAATGIRDFNIINYFDDEAFEELEEGDKVFGNLPLTWVIKILNKGCEYYNFTPPKVSYNLIKRGMKDNELKRLPGEIFKVERVIIRKDVKAW